MTEPVTVPVLTIQRQLRRVGFNPGSVDGRWGERTASALKRFYARIGFSTGPTELPLEVDSGGRSVRIERPAWQQLTRGRSGMGGEDMSTGSAGGSSGGASGGSGSGSGSGAGSGSGGGSGAGSGSSGGRTTGSTPPPTNNNARAADDSGEGADWWRSPWLWGAVALAAGAGVVFVATRETEPALDEGEDELEDEELLPAF